MTPESRILVSINSARSSSAWSPMPEHLLFLQINKDTSTKPDTPENVVNNCEQCGMHFKTEAMLTYHKAGFCVGKPTEERPSSPFQLPGEETIMLKAGKKPEHSPTRERTQAGTTVNKQSTQRESKLEWCESADGTVPPSAVKVGFDEHDQTHTYVCLAQVGEAVIPGTVLPFRKHATVALDGYEFIAKEYSVLTDLEGRVTWKRCDVIGAIPRGAVKGGYDPKKFQYFIARGKAPDGTHCCGQYIPHKQQCYFAWEGSEFITKDFDFLCKTYPDRFLKLGSGNNGPSKDTDGNPKQLASSGTELILRDKHKTKEFAADTERPPDRHATQSTITKTVTIDLSRSATGVIVKDQDGVNKTPVRSGTHVKEQENADSARDKVKANAARELTKSGTGIVTKEKSKPKELTKTGTAVILKNKSNLSNSRTNSGTRTNTKNLQF